VRDGAGASETVRETRPLPRVSSWRGRPRGGERWSPRRGPTVGRTVAYRRLCPSRALGTSVATTSLVSAILRSLQPVPRPDGSLVSMDHTDPRGPGRSVARPSWDARRGRDAEHRRWRLSGARGAGVDDSPSLGRVRQDLGVCRHPRVIHQLDACGRDAKAGALSGSGRNRPPGIP
jgi:hypothetical protein